MPGVKGKTGTHTNRSNQWLAGSSTRIRTDEVFSFKPKIEVIDAIKEDIEQSGVSKTEWLDAAVEAKLNQSNGEEEDISSDALSLSKGDIPGCVRDAIATAIGLKSAAISRERKAKKSDENAIAQWQAEIDELEKFL